MLSRNVPYFLLLAGALGAFVLLASPPSVRSQITQPGQGGPNGYQQITSLSSATKLTFPAGTGYVVVCAETQAVRWRDDNVAPTSSVGMPLAVGQCIPFPAPSPNLQFIQQTASATINANYYK